MCHFESRMSPLSSYVLLYGLMMHVVTSDSPARCDTHRGSVDTSSPSLDVLVSLCYSSNVAIHASIGSRRVGSHIHQVLYRGSASWPVLPEEVFRQSERVSYCVCDGGLYIIVPKYNSVDVRCSFLSGRRCGWCFATHATALSHNAPNCALK